MQVEFLHSRLITSTIPNRTFSKTELWKFYWQVNQLKCWIWFLHLRVSTGKYESKLYDYINDSWKENGENIDWNALHIIYM